MAMHHLGHRLGHVVPAVTVRHGPVLTPPQEVVVLRRVSIDCRSPRPASVGQGRSTSCDVWSNKYSFGSLDVQREDTVGSVLRGPRVSA